ncbi:MAG: hypothetical protein JWM43_2852 [Acidobacteriaceae bacterium]|nr:hypothetical protein [Acidobacteriaceae bacterium]
MNCQACGTPVAAGVRFCSRCGAPVQPPATPPGYPAPGALQPRVGRNLQTMGLLWCLFGAYRLIGGIIGIFFLQVASMRRFAFDGWGYGPFSHGSFSHGPAWMAAVIPFVAFYTTLVAGLALFVGFSLLTRKPWGRTLAIVVAILALFKPILGTALGIYTLWVLAPAQSAVEFDAIADRD